MSVVAKGTRYLQRNSVDWNHSGWTKARSCAGPTKGGLLVRTLRFAHPVSIRSEAALVAARRVVISRAGSHLSEAM
jgi:hypothetical protein